MPRRQALSAEDVAHLVEVYESGEHSFASLGQHFGISTSAAWRAYTKHYTKRKEQRGAIEHTRPDEDFGLVDNLDGIKTGEHVSVHTDGHNQATVTNMPNSMIHTIEQLLSYCEIDEEVWKVEKPEVTAWPGWRKAKQIDLKWVDGLQTGFVKDSGSIATSQLVRVFARLVRRHPIPVFPHLQPIQPTHTYDRPDPIYFTGNIKTTLVVADSHVGFRRAGPGLTRLDPFHDRQAMDTAYRVAEAVQPDEIVIVGDKLDLPDWSTRFHRQPDIHLVTQPALIELHWWLARMRAMLPGARIVYLAGNHEKRFSTMIEAHIPAAYKLKSVDDLDGWDQFSLPKLLGLDGLGVEYIEHYPQGSYFISDELETEHGSISRKGQGDTSKAIMRSRSNSVFSGHIHRPELVSGIDRRGGVNSPIQAICPGCLCRLDGSVPGHDPKNQEWAHGVGVVRSHEPSGFFNAELHRILDGITIVGGELIQGVDYTDQLRADFPEHGF
jgi:hypothetical protein